MNDWENGWKINTYGDYIRKTDQGDGYICEWESDRSETSLNYYNKAVWDLFAAKLRLSYDTEKAGSISFGYDFSHTSGTNYIENVRALNNGRTKNMELKNSLFLAYDFPGKSFDRYRGPL